MHANAPAHDAPPSSLKPSLETSLGLLGRSVLKMKLVETSGNEEKRKGSEYETGKNELKTGKLLLKRTYLTCSLP